MKRLKKTAFVLLTAILLSTVSMGQEEPLFFEELLAEGAWIRLNDTAWGWQPVVMQMDPDWHPYLHAGSWMWNYEHWFWASEYAWASIAFHYGRWFETETYGWVWVPDSQWCPAWVDWRLTSTHTAWAPLPPSNTFLESIGITNYTLHADQYVVVPNAAFKARNLVPFAVAGNQGIHDAIMSFRGPSPENVGSTGLTSITLPLTFELYPH